MANRERAFGADRNDVAASCRPDQAQRRSGSMDRKDANVEDAGTALRSVRPTVNHKLTPNFKKVHHVRTTHLAPPISETVGDRDGDHDFHRQFI